MKMLRPETSLAASIFSLTWSRVGPLPSSEIIGTGVPPIAFTESMIEVEKSPLEQTNASSPLETRFRAAISTASWPGTGMTSTSFLVLKTFCIIAVVSLYTASHFAP
jgi:hypothetical protein